MMLMAPPWMSGSKPGFGGELGQPVQREVDLHRAGPRSPVLDVVDELVGQVVPVDLVQEGDLRVARRDDEVGGDLLTVLEHHSGGPAVRHRDLRDAGVHANLGTERLGGSAAGVRDGTHPSDRLSPGRHLAAGLVADGVVHEHVGGTGAHRAGPGADDAVDGLRAQDHRVLEPAGEQVGRAHREEPGDVGDRALVDLLAEHPGEHPEVLDVAELLRPHVRAACGRAAGAGCPRCARSTRSTGRARRRPSWRTPRTSRTCSGRR